MLFPFSLSIPIHASRKDSFSYDAVVWDDEGCTSQVFLLFFPIQILLPVQPALILLPERNKRNKREGKTLDLKTSLIPPSSPASARLVIFSQFSTDDDVILLLVVGVCLYVCVYEC